MRIRSIATGVAVAGALAVSGSVATAATSKSPKQVTIKVSQKIVMKPNRWIQDGLRWDRDIYNVTSGATLKVVNTAAGEGPHTFTVVQPKDLPRTAAQTTNCSICNKLAKAHGADPSSDAPPKFLFLENGVGQATAPEIDRPGDSGVTGEGKKGESITLKVTAKKGATLTFMCIIHPWMQAKVKVH